MKYCSNTVRDLIHKYFKLLNGKCDAILYENVQEHRNKTAANTEKRLVGQLLTLSLLRILGFRLRDFLFGFETYRLIARYLNAC
jgi:hypothetical protein